MMCHSHITQSQQDGEIIEKGTLEELDRKGTAFYNILTHKGEVDNG